MIDLLQKLVSIPSFYPAEQAISSYVERLVKSYGARVDRVCTGADRYNLVVTVGEATSYLGFYGHLDTVPPVSDYTIDPYQMIIAGDVARGLGVCDMKGGLACIISAIEYAVKNELPLKACFGVDEENISTGAHDLVDSGLLDNIDFLVVPETGHVQDYNEAFSVCYGRCGRIVYDIFVKGSACHVAASEDESNAIFLASDFIKALNKIDLPKHSELGETKAIPEAMIANSAQFVTPEMCQIRCSLMTSPAAGKKDFENWIKDYERTNKVEIYFKETPRATPYSESYQIDTNHDFLKLLEQNVITPAGVSPRYTPSVADENVFANRLKIPVLTLGPIGGAFHSCNEWVNLNSVDLVADIYKKIVKLHFDHNLN